TENVRRPIVAITRTMPLVGSALGYHLHLSPDGTVEVSRLTKGVNAKLLDTLQRRRYNTGSHAIGLSAGRSRKVYDIADRVPRHVVCVLATINRKSVLVTDGAGDLTGRRDARL